MFAEENIMQHLGFVEGLTSFPKQFEKWISYNKIYHIANILTPNVAGLQLILTYLPAFILFSRKLKDGFILSLNFMYELVICVLTNLIIYMFLILIGDFSNTNEKSLIFVCDRSLITML